MGVGWDLATMQAAVTQPEIGWDPTTQMMVPFPYKSPIWKKFEEDLTRSDVKARQQYFGVINQQVADGARQAFKTSLDTKPTANPEFSSDPPEQAIIHIGEEFDPEAPSLQRSGLPPVNPLQVEILLDQAAKLLDRALQEDGLRRRMAIQYFNLTLDNWEYQQLNAVNQLEVAYGADFADLNESTAAADGEDAQLTSKVNYEKALIEDNDRQNCLAGWAVENALNPAQGYNAAQVNTRRLVKLGGYAPDPRFDKLKDIPLETTANWVGEAVAYETAYYDLSHQKLQAEGDKEVAKARQPSLRAKESYARADVSFRRMRRSVARIKLYKKLEEASRPDGAINYGPRIEESGRRILQDLADSHARVIAISAGVKAVYGFEALGLPVTKKHTYLDESVRWLRDVAERVQRITANDQAIVLRILLSKTGEIQFDKGPWSFNLSPPNPNIRLARLRGICAFAVFNPHDPERFISLRVQPPPPDPSLKFPPLQDCLIARTVEQNPSIQVEWFGTSTLFNVNPFGKWTLELISDSNHSPGTISEIVLDLKVNLQIR